MQAFSKYFQWLLAFIFIGVGAYGLSLDAITLPSRYGAAPHHISGLGVYLIACLPLSFGLTMLIGLALPNSPKALGGSILAAGFLVFAVGFMFF